MTDAPAAPVRVLLVDDQHLIRAGFRMILADEPGIEVVGDAADGRAALEAAARLRPDVVVMDLRMPVLDGVEATRRLSAGGPDVLRLLARGLSNREIADSLVVAETTVKTHVSHVLDKLELRDRAQAVVLAYEIGLVRAGGS